MDSSQLTSSQSSTISVCMFFSGNEKDRPVQEGSPL
jgi:hypothetical protein